MREWWNVENGQDHNGWLIMMYGGRYPFGCGGTLAQGGDSRHHGVDIRPAGSGNHRTGFTEGGGRSRVFAWGPGVVRFRSWDPGGYYRFIGVYFPSVNYSLDIGHMAEHSGMAAGTRFEAGDVWGLVGNRRDGLGARHVHFRAAPGNYGQSAIGPCQDRNPGILFDKLNP